MAFLMGFFRPLSVYNFLRFEEEEWSGWNPPQLFQNRLRHCDYRELFQAEGFSIVEEEALMPDDGMAQAMATLLATPFRSYAAADLAATTGWFVLRPQI